MPKAYFVNIISLLKMFFSISISICFMLCLITAPISNCLEWVFEDQHAPNEVTSALLNALPFNYTIEDYNVTKTANNQLIILPAIPRSITMDEIAAFFNAVEPLNAGTHFQFMDSIEEDSYTLSSIPMSALKTGFDYTIQFSNVSYNADSDLFFAQPNATTLASQESSMHLYNETSTQSKRKRGIPQSEFIFFEDSGVCGRGSNTASTGPFDACHNSWNLKYKSVAGINYTEDLAVFITWPHHKCQGGNLKYKKAPPGISICLEYPAFSAKMYACPKC